MNRCSFMHAYYLVISILKRCNNYSWSKAGFSRIPNTISMLDYQLILCMNFCTNYRAKFAN